LGRAVCEGSALPFFFVGYALAVWFLAAKWRRMPMSFVVVAAGLLGLMALNVLHGKLNDWTQGTIYLPVLRSIMYPYTGLVAVVGLYIACLPRRVDAGCLRCGYDLFGLAKAGQPCRCPECGTEQTLAERPVFRRSGSDRGELFASDTLSAADQPDQPADEKDAERRTEQQSPAET